MTFSWRIGRVAGIDVFLHPTILFLLFLPGVLGGGLLPLALVASVFGCVLLHELGHALAARRFGIETQDITLYPIGGVARLVRMPRSPGAELVIALAGPAVNLAIMAGLAALGLNAPGTFTGALFQVNFMLAAFNLIPAFPMDGGRVLRALLSPGLGRVNATAVAAGLGRGLALLFGVWALSQFQFLQVALAAFIYLMAGAELARVVAEEQSRRYSGGAANDGVWVAPPGFHWVSRGNGLWQLAPVTVRSQNRGGPRWN